MYYLIALLFLSNAFAVMGEYSEKQSQSTCKMEVKLPCEADKDRTCTGTCSASYLGEGKFITANHCNKLLWNSRGASMLCPGSEPLTIEEKSGTTLPSKYFKYTQDIAIVKTTTMPQIKPIKYVRSEEEFNLLIKDPSKCFMAGYGLDNNGNHGKLITAQAKSVKSDNVRRTDGGSPFGYSVPAQFSLRENYANHGDSGGSFYCEGEDGPVLLGVLQGGTKGVEISFTEKVFLGSEWIDYMMSPFAKDMNLFNSAKSLESMCEAILGCFSGLEQSGSLSLDVLKILKPLFYDLKKEHFSSWNIEGVSEYDKRIEQLNSQYEQWLELHKQCFGELYK